ncbi:MAG: aminotransferase class V-fold PLP-dependent enzyme [Actinobacteria bacterium]|nr:aminotransferase class V-fold PLP-dependent enzyme [Actinomycetota bacterium]
MDIEKIRQDFPLLETKFNGKPVVYFDNACQALRPLSVINAINDYYVKYPACAGRSAHKLGETVTEKCEEARKTIAKFIGAKRKEEIIFTRNTTEGINIVAKSLGLKAGDIVLTTDKEHNSNLIPWQILSEKIGVIHKIIPSREDNTFDLERFKEMMEELGGKVKLAAMVFTSNLDGASIPAKKIISIARQYGAKVLLDAAAAAPHRKIDAAELDVDFLAFSGHKMLGPSGTGILYGKYRLLENMDPFLTGGDTVEYSTYRGHKLLPPPEKFEAGLQDYAGIIGLSEAVKYLERVGFKNIAEQEYRINKFITDEIIKISRVKIIGPADPAERGGIISFYMEGIDSHQIALILDQAANIMIRSGQHCVHSWFSAKGIKNSARVSLYFYNTMEEAEIFVENFKKITKLL